jgi:predicted transcriptional regulator YdeE
MEAPILIPPNWQLEFHVHTNASLLVIGVMLAQNATGEYDQPIVYAFRLLNKVEHNYITIEIKALAMVYALHKFKLFCWEKNLFFM